MEGLVDIEISSYASSNSSDHLLYCSGTFDLDTDSVQTQSLSLSSLSVEDSKKDNSSSQSSVCKISSKQGSCLHCSTQPTIMAKDIRNKTNEKNGGKSPSLCNSDDDDNSLNDFIFGYSSVSLSSCDSDYDMEIDSNVHSDEEKRYNRSTIEQGLLDMSFEEIFYEHCEKDHDHDSTALAEVNFNESQGDITLLQKEMLLSCNNQDNKQIDACSHNCGVEKVEKRNDNYFRESSVISETGRQSRGFREKRAESKAQPLEIIDVHCSDNIVLNRIKKKYRSDPIRFRRKKKHHIQYSDGRISNKKGHASKKNFHQRKRSNKNETDHQHLLSSYTYTKTGVSSQEKYFEGPFNKSRLSESSLVLAKKLVKKMRHRRQYNPMYSSDVTPLKRLTAYNSFTPTHEQFNMMDSSSEASEEETPDERSWTLAPSQRLCAIEELDEESNQGNLTVGEVDEDINKDFFTFEKSVKSDNNNNVLSYQCSFPDGTSVKETFPNALDNKSKIHLLDINARRQIKISSETDKSTSNIDRAKYSIVGGHESVKIKIAPTKMSNNDTSYSEPLIDDNCKRDGLYVNEKVLFSKEIPLAHDSMPEYFNFSHVNDSFVDLSSTHSCALFSAPSESIATNQEVEVSLLSRSYEKQSLLAESISMAKAFDPSKDNFESSASHSGTSMKQNPSLSPSSSFRHVSPIWTEEEEKIQPSHVGSLLECNVQNKSNNMHRDEVKLVSSRLLTSKIDSEKIFEETNRVMRDDSSWNEEIKQAPSISLPNLQKLSVKTEYKRPNVNELKNYFEQRLSSQKLWKVQNGGSGEESSFNDHEILKQTSFNSSSDKTPTAQICDDLYQPEKKTNIIAGKHNHQSIEAVITEFTGPSTTNSSEGGKQSSKLKSTRRSYLNDCDVHRENILIETTTLPSQEQSSHDNSRERSFGSVDTKVTFAPRPDFKKYNGALLPKQKDFVMNATTSSRIPTKNREDSDTSPTHSSSRTSQMKILLPEEAQEHEKAEHYDQDLENITNVESKLQSCSRTPSVLQFWERAKLKVELEKI